MSSAAWPSSLRHIASALARLRRRRASRRDHRRELSRPTIRHGGTPSSACRNAAASCSRPRSTARSMPNTARHRHAPDRHRQACPPKIRRRFRRLRAWRRTSPRCSAGSCEHVPPRLPIAIACRRCRRPRVRSFRGPVRACCHAPVPRTAAPAIAILQAVELAYETVDLDAGRGRPHHRRALRRLRASDDPYSRRAAASHQARAVGRDGVGRAAEADLPAAPAATSSPTACCRTRSSKAVIYAGEAHSGTSRRILDGRRDLRRRHRGAPTTPRTPCASGAAGFSATAPAPARAARSPASSSTTG